MSAKDKNGFTGRLWLNERFYIPIDEQGYCNGKFYEGALGIIVQIKDAKGGSYALKIPRLMADTPKENAYIAELLMEEKRSIEQIFGDDDPTHGLMEAQVMVSTLLQKSIQTPEADQEARALNNSIITAQFKKGMPPRFCAIKQDAKEKEGQLAVFPSKVVDCPLQDSAALKEAKAQARRGDRDWEKAVVVSAKQQAKAPDIFILDGTYNYQDNETLWYVCIPAVVYSWGTSTLQEAIANGKLKTWGLFEQLTLISTIIDGVDSLHRRGYLHTDIRPANVMSKGDSDNPKNFYLIDYAGYNLGLTPNAAQSHLADDGFNLTALGPSIGGERNSPFYAPERKKGIEKEGADTAVILNRGDHYLIFFGWRSMLVERETNQVRADILEELEEFDFPDLADGEEEGEEKRNRDFRNQVNENDLLLPGDRLQIREYIFDIDGISQFTETLPGVEVYRSKKQYWKIFHNRIVIKAETEFTQDWIAIPRIVELRQWAVATDCFGVGALFLYNLYRRGGDDERQDKITAEISFQRMLEELENPHFLNDIWFELSRVCYQLNLCHERKFPHDQLAVSYFKPEDFRHLSSAAESEGEKTLMEYATFLTTMIVHSVPDTMQILKNLRYNFVYFLYALYFALCCLHRQHSMDREVLEDTGSRWEDRHAGAEEEKETKEEIQAEKAKKKDADKEPEGQIILPFCRSRTIKPGDEGGHMPIQTAQGFIRKFIRIVQSEYYEAYHLKPSDIKNPQSQPAPVLRREVGKLKERYEGMEKILNDVREQLQGKKAEITELKAQLQELAEKGNQLENQIGTQEKASVELKDKINRLNVVKATTGARLSRLEQIFKEMDEGLRKLVRSSTGLKKGMMGYAKEEVESLQSEIGRLERQLDQWRDEV